MTSVQEAYRKKTRQSARLFTKAKKVHIIESKGNWIGLIES